MKYVYPAMKPSWFLSSRLLLMCACMDFNGVEHHDDEIVFRLSRRFRITPEAMISAIGAVYPTTATNSVH